MRRSIKYKRKEIRLNPRILRGVVMPIACVVLFWTVYALILPAITQEKQANCGMEAHVHSEVCYDDAGVLRCDLPEHTHTDACYADPTLAGEVLGWHAQYGLDEMCRDANRWQTMNPDGYGEE